MLQRQRPPSSSQTLTPPTRGCMVKTLSEGLGWGNAEVLVLVLVYPLPGWVTSHKLHILPRLEFSRLHICPYVTPKVIIKIV